MDQIIQRLFQVLDSEWATVKAHAEAFVAVLGIGLFFGWTLAWLILKNRLTHHKELVATYEAVIAAKIPALRDRAATTFSLGRMFSGVAILLIAVIAPLYVLIYFQKPLITSKAVLQFDTIRLYKTPPDSLNYFNVQISNNAANLPAINTTGAVSGLVSSNLTPDQIKEELNKLNDKVRDIEKDPDTQSRLPDAIIQNGQGILLTIPDIGLTDADWNKIVPGTQASLYVFIIMDYQDEISEKYGYWHYVFCGYFTGTTIFWHNCGPNRPQFVKGSLYQ
jgi:hypothetical protein